MDVVRATNTKITNKTTLFRKIIALSFFLVKVYFMTFDGVSIKSYFSF